jgi:hypothetical protein
MLVRRASPLFPRRFREKKSIVVEKHGMGHVAARESQLKVMMRGVVRRGRKQNLCVSLLQEPHAPPPQPALQPDATSEQDQHPEEDGCRGPEFEEGGVGR